MFKPKRSLRERSIEFRDPLRPLTDREAETAREIQVVALLEELHLDICEIKQMLKIFDLYFERERTAHGYRDPRDMKRLREAAP